MIHKLLTSQTHLKFKFFADELLIPALKRDFSMSKSIVLCMFFVWNWVALIKIKKLEQVMSGIVVASVVRSIVLDQIWSLK